MPHPDLIKRITNWSEYRGGDRISAGNVASKLKISAPQARSALDEMAKTGLLVTLPDGSYAAPRLSRALLTRAWV